MATTLPPDDVPLSTPAPNEPGGPREPAAEDMRDPLGVQRHRQRIAWTTGVLVLLLLAGLAAWFAHDITVDRRLQAVGKAAVLGPQTPEAPAPLVPSAAPAQQAPAEPAAASLAAGETLVEPAALAAAAVATTALAAAGRQDAVGPAGKADGDAPVRKVRKAGKKRTPRRQAAASAERDRTFIRCPPLGREGAVMCRWHVCNGAAGKEAACRPYLERKP